MHGLEPGLSGRTAGLWYRGLSRGMGIGQDQQDWETDARGFCGRDSVGCEAVGGIRPFEGLEGLAPSGLQVLCC